MTSSIHSYVLNMDLYYICASYLFFWIVQNGRCCIFFTVMNRKMTSAYITQNHTVMKQADECEFLCYKNRDNCAGANVVPQPDGTYQCQFVSVAVQTQYIGMLETIMGSKYFSWSNMGKYLTLIVPNALLYTSSKTWVSI